MHLDGIGIFDAVHVEVGFGAEKSWLEQWGLVERAYKRVQDLYAAGSVDNREAQAVVKEFFIHSWHLSDWLRKDPSTSVRFEDIGTLVTSQPDMRVCNAMANTSKHFDLDGKMTARVSRVVVHPQCLVTIEITRTTGSEERDALDLATSCMGIWRKFLHLHGLNP
ncbi:hypothetical protein [Arthrobacter burdickii]|uniref:Uncharacterized protein n=1 Tax=Arthrobacter burdickii TaxID=3035920 RepID=A0ABT8K276_9MICC|nr:hypothetical protein [Arthrobacter burdickii]MDN4611464.1 hypothetical protein [Arthrobacter burdickii]